MHNLSRLRTISILTLLLFIFSTIAPYTAMAFDEGEWFLGGETMGASFSSKPPDSAGKTELPDATGKNKEETDCNATAGKPVFLFSGEESYGCVDLVVPQRGEALILKHFYRSGKAYNGQFGYSWTFNFYHRLHILSNGNVVITGGDGRKDEYTYNPTSGQFVASRGIFETLEQNITDGSWTLTDAEANKLRFDINGNLIAKIDRNGNQLTFVYDSRGLLPVIGAVSPFSKNATGRVVVAYDYRLTRIIDELGRNIDLVYNTDGRLTTITDFAGRVVSFNYDAITDDLLSITRPATPQFPGGVTKTFSYDANHHLINFTDPKGQIYATNFYDTKGRVYRQDLGSGSINFTYGVNQTTVTDRKGFVATYTFNTAGALIKKEQFTQGLRPTDPASFITTYTYNNDSMQTSITYPGGNGVKFAYDETNPNPRSHGNLLQARYKSDMTAPDSAANDMTITMTYDPPFNRIKTLTDAKGNVTSFSYDYELPPNDPKYAVRGNVVKVVYPTAGAQTPQVNFSYNALGQMISHTDANGNITAFDYIPATGLLNLITRDPAGVNSVTQFTYDAFLNLDTTIDPNNHTTDYAYNALGWLIDETNPLGFKTKYTYDANANVTKVERQMNAGATTWQTTQFTYDNLNHMKTVLDPLNRTTTYNYDLNENLASVLDARNFTTTYMYDERDLLFKVTDANSPAAGLTQYDYDGALNLKKLTDANGNATSYTYDGFNRLTQTTYPDTRFSKYDYDLNSNVIRHTTPGTKVIEYDYDTLNRLTATRYLSTASLNKTFSYDTGSRLTTANTAAANNAFTYDALNRVKTNPETLNGATYTLSYTYDKENLTKTTYPSGKVIDYVYDNNDRLTNLKVNTVTLSNYTYDLLDRRATKDLMGTATQRSTYTFDAANQLSNLLNAIVGGANISQYGYTYDNVGNRLTMTAPNGTHTYTYNNIEELVSVAGAQTHNFAYDKVANRTTVDGVAYTKNNLNQYTQVGTALYSYDTNGNLTTDGVNTYTYDEENRLATFSKAGTTASYTYDAFNRRVSKTVNGVTTYFVYDGDEDVEERNSSGVLQADYVYGNNLDEVLTMTRGATTYYYQYDGLGSVTRLTNAAGATVESYNYDVYGQPSITSTIGNPFFFTGRRLDSESGIYYYRARMYDPKIGRFLQRDPIGYYDSMNLFEYVYNNPVNFTDPLGLMGLHEGFIHMIKKMADKSLRKTMKSLKKRIQEHILKSKSKHHDQEIKTFKEQYDLAKEEAKKRGMEKFGFVPLLPDDKSNDDSENKPCNQQDKNGMDKSTEDDESWWEWFDPLGADNAY